MESGRTRVQCDLSPTATGYRAAGDSSAGKAFRGTDRREHFFACISGPDSAHGVRVYKRSSAFLAVLQDKVAPEWRRIKISFLALVTGKSDTQATQVWRRRQSLNWMCVYGCTHANTQHGDCPEGASDSHSWCFMSIPSPYYPGRTSQRSLCIVTTCLHLSVPTSLWICGVTGTMCYSLRIPKMS